ncbi:MAG: PEP-CTERM sorting domain-containing protein [Bryobacteraceae bacterium]
MRIKMRLSFQAAGAFLLLSVCGADTASAAVMFYTSQSAFNAAATSLTSFGFNSLVTGSGSVGYSTAAGLTLNGFNFAGTTGTPSNPYRLGAEGPDFYFNDYNRVAGASSLQGPPTSSAFYNVTNGATTITTPSGGVTAFGLVLFDVLTSDITGAGTDTVNLKAGGSTGSVVTPAFTGTAFIGFTSTTPITSVTLTGTIADEFPTISSVYYGTPGGPSTVPEPGTFGLLSVAGLGAICFTLKRRNRQSVAVIPLPAARGGEQPIQSQLCEPGW